MLTTNHYHSSDTVNRSLTPMCNTCSILHSTAAAATSRCATYQYHHIHRYITNVSPCSYPLNTYIRSVWSQTVYIYGLENWQQWNGLRPQPSGGHPLTHYVVCL